MPTWAMLIGQILLINYFNFHPKWTRMLTKIKAHQVLDTRTSEEHPGNVVQGLGGFSTRKNENKVEEEQRKRDSRNRANTILHHLFDVGQLISTSANSILAKHLLLV